MINQWTMSEVSLICFFVCSKFQCVFWVEGFSNSLFSNSVIYQMVELIIIINQSHTTFFLTQVLQFCWITIPIVPDRRSCSLEVMEWQVHSEQSTCTLSCLQLALCAVALQVAITPDSFWLLRKQFSCCIWWKTSIVFSWQVWWGQVWAFSQSCFQSLTLSCQRII